MTIQEAIKSGKRFRRATWALWHKVCIHADLFEFEEAGSKYTLPLKSLGPTDILADDWEIEEEKVEVTRKQAAAAYHEAFDEVYLRGAHPGKLMMDVILEKLGFKS